MDIAPSWNANEWNAFGNVLLGVGALAAGAWSIFNYRRNRRAEAARWLQGVFRDFYLEGRFRDIKLVMEYSYSERLGPLLERRITDPHVPVTEHDTALLEQLDTLLNYFEHVLYLEGEKHLTTEDRQAVFEYWFDLMEKGYQAATRRYAAHFGFERVARALNADEAELVVLYGSLMSDVDPEERPDELATLLRKIGGATVRGELFDLGEYPGLKSGEGRVEGELYEVLDHRAFQVLDGVERYDATDPDRSLYIRRLVRLVEPPRDAWVYVYNDSVDETAKLEVSSWKEHLAESTEGLGN